MCLLILRPTEFLPLGCIFDALRSLSFTKTCHSSKPMSPTLGQHTHSAQVSCWSFVLEVISVMSFCWVDYLVWLAYIDAGTLACSVGSWCIAQTAHFGFDVLLSLRPWTRASYWQLSHRCRWLFRRSRTTCVQNFWRIMLKQWKALKYQ